VTYFLWLRLPDIVTVSKPSIAEYEMADHLLWLCVPDTTVHVEVLLAGHISGVGAQTLVWIVPRYVSTGLL
jgi:hypothetical protein